MSVTSDLHSKLQCYTSHDQSLSYQIAVCMSLLAVLSCDSDTTGYISGSLQEWVASVLLPAGVCVMLWSA